MSERFLTRPQVPDLQMLERGINALPGVLDRMGFKEMRKGQDQVILNFLAGLDTIAVLPTATGKCLGENEKVQVFRNGEIVSLSVRDIVFGDFLPSPLGENLYTRVTALARGHGPLYVVTPEDESYPPYVVNYDHILSCQIGDSLGCEGKVINISVSEYINLNDQIKDALYGWALRNGKVTKFKFSVEYQKQGSYFGFSLSNSVSPDHRAKGNLFMLESGIVTHNSACFIIPTLCLDQHNLIISPLVALMQDQVQSLWRKGIKAGQLSSTQTDAENLSVMKRWVDGDVSIMYVAPERLDNQLLKAALLARKPDAIHVDEAHAISAWGTNFRPHYKKIGDVVRELNPKVVGAFTATCRPQTERDIREVLGLADAKRVFHYPRRSNLILSGAREENPIRVLRYIKETKGATIAYFSTIRRLEETLSTAQNLINEPITYYHGSLPPANKRANQRDFMEDRVRIIFATSAFGMGIDKPDIRNIVNFDIPDSLDSLAQQDGRAGRDGLDSWCRSFLSPEGLRTQEFFMRCKYPKPEELAKFYMEMEARADGDGNVTAGVTAMARSAGIDPLQVDSILSNLFADGVIERSGEKALSGFVKYLLLDRKDKRFMEWHDIIHEGGIDNDGVIEIDLSWLSNRLGYSNLTQVKKWLRQWESQGLLVFRPPRAKAPIQIIGSLSKIDFNRITEMAEQGRRQLELVQEYFDIPDEAKHSYLEQYFKTENQQS